MFRIHMKLSLLHSKLSLMDVMLLKPAKYMPAVAWDGKKKIYRFHIYIYMYIFLCYMIIYV